jgi:hypothetical protein
MPIPQTIRVNPLDLQKNIADAANNMSPMDRQGLRQLD